MKSVENKEEAAGMRAKKPGVRFRKDGRPERRTGTSRRTGLVEVREWAVNCVAVRLEKGRTERSKARARAIKQAVSVRGVIMASVNSTVNHC